LGRKKEKGDPDTFRCEKSESGSSREKKKEKGEKRGAHWSMGFEGLCFVGPEEKKKKGKKRKKRKKKKTKSV